MKFKKLVLISASTLITSASLIALAAACHDKNQKKPGNGNNKEVKTDNKTSASENKDQQTKQKQIINPELNQKQTDKSDSKQEKQKLTTSPNLNKKEQEKESQDKQKDPNKTIEKETPKSKDNNFKKNTEEQLHNQSSKSQTQTPKVIKKDEQNTELNQKEKDQKNKSTKKESENHELSTKEQPNNKKELFQHPQVPNINSDQTNKEQKFNEDPLKKGNNEVQKEEKFEEPKKVNPEVQEISDVSFNKESPVINQEINYALSYLKLKINNDFFRNNPSKKLFKVKLRSQDDNHKIIEGIGYYDSKKDTNNEGVIDVELININPSSTYLLEFVAAIDKIDEYQENANEVNLKLSTKVKSTQIKVQQKKYNFEIEDNEKNKTPVVVSADLLKENSDYKIELTFNTANNQSEINNKYVGLTILYGDYTNLYTFHHVQDHNYKIEKNKVTINIDNRFIKGSEELQVNLQRITDEQESIINSTTFRLDYKSPNSVVDANKNLVFKLSTKKFKNQ